MVSGIPLPFTAQLRRRLVDTGRTDARGNPAVGFADPVTVACCWWTPDVGTTPSPGHDGHTVVARVWMIDAATACGPGDLVDFEDGRYRVHGHPGDWDCGPFGFAPGRSTVPLTKVEES